MNLKKLTPYILSLLAFTAVGIYNDNVTGALVAFVVILIFGLVIGLIFRKFFK